MKEVIKNVASKFGLKIERLDNPNPLTRKYEQAIRELYGAYRATLFQHLPELDEDEVKLLSRLDGTQLSEAIYILQSLAKTKSLQGDVCEFGVAQGFTSSLLAYHLTQTTKTLWLFDSFEGLPKPTEKDKLKDDIFNLGSMEAYQGTMKHSQEVVIGHVQETGFPLNRLKIIDGFIEKTIHQPRLPEKVCFAYVDFDFYEPILIALEFLHRTLVPGGIVVVDDYDFFSEGAKLAVDEFFAAHQNDYILDLPIKTAGHFALLTKRS